MKIIKLLFAIILFITALSCTDDDNKKDISGIYKLTAVNAPRATDFNKDGTPSINLMDESNCYQSSFIELRQDGTFNSKYNYVFFFSSSGCYTEEIKGIWNQKGNTITLTNPLAPDETTGAVQYNLEGNILSLTQASSYPGYDIDGEPVFIEGMVEKVYEKAEE